MRNRRTSGPRPPIGPAHAKMGQLLHDLRLRQDMKLRDLEEVVSIGYLSELEHGRQTPTRAKLTSIVRKLRGDLGPFIGLLPALEREREAHNKRMKEQRNGVTPVDLGLVYDTKVPLENPIIEVIDDETGIATIVEPEVADPNNLNFLGPFVVEEVDEQHYVNADRFLYKSIYNRRVRATEPGLRTFPFSFGETPPDAITVSKFQIGVRAPAYVERVLQLGKLAYKVEIGFPETVKPGEIVELSFFKISIDAVGYCDPFIGGSCAREIEHGGRIAVYFEDGGEPVRVWWFENLTPYTLPGLYSPEREVMKKATGQYEKRFSKYVPSLMSGVAWAYDDQLL